MVNGAPIAPSNGQLEPEPIQMNTADRHNADCELPPTQAADHSQECTAPSIKLRSDSVDDELAFHPQIIGRYRVQRLLGDGGFGSVYLAVDEELNRRVAVKVPHQFRISRPDDVAAYLNEARILASLDHPAIVPVYDFGRTEDGRCFAVSKYIEGSDLAAKAKQVQLTFAATAKLVAAVADALHFAHLRGIVHRDVKPANILLDANDSPYLADFGIALREEDFGKDQPTTGTPAYMSPEQARGEGHLVDGRSDIFSLGIVLYELLIHRKPFGPNGLVHSASIEPRPPRQIDDTVPVELERICLKALAPRVADRYSTARDMADDLNHFARDGDVGGARLAAPSASGPVADASGGHHAVSTVLTIVPKGLRSFDRHDADFFLGLLPGPRERDGFPESVRFWTRRISETDAEKTFRIGLIYGPSGCGKSSFLKAGVLPSLPKEVITAYVESTAAETEVRLLKALRKCCPNLPHHLGLAETMTLLRRSQPPRAGAKVLVVLDQFEQWLSSRRREENSELIRALRQCDAAHLQCVVAVRDDFWMAVTHFMEELEVSLVPDQNCAAVDLFNLRHAKKVLAAVGRAYGALPAGPHEMNAAAESFIEKAVADLAHHEQITPVHLALFAEMVKDKPWIPATLKDVGGAKGVGVTFLEETFNGPTANPSHRAHQRAARAVLKTLLSDRAETIKGGMRSYQELLEASGYSQRPQAFDALLRILDSELRLVTPTDPEGLDAAGSTEVAAPNEQARYYHLTHDYLVPSLQEWLVRRQKETRRGRAELNLAERDVLWRAKPEQRQLPSMTEWFAIRLFTTPRTWTDSQHQMMRSADRTHLIGLARLAAAVMLLVFAVAFLRDRLAVERAAARADGIVHRLLDSHIAQTPAIIEELADYRHWTDPRLEQVLADPTAGRDRQLRARLALVPVEHRYVEDLRENLLEADANEFPIIRDSLAPHCSRLNRGLWELLEADNGEADRRFRAAVALATFDPASSRWEGAKQWVGERLVAQPSLVLSGWVDALRPIKNQLIPALTTILRDPAKPQATPAVVAEILGDYAAEQPEVLADALAHADPTTFAILLPRLKAHRNRAVSALAAILDRPTPNPDSAPNQTAQQRINVAIAILQLQSGERLWPLLKASFDPRARSFAIARLGPLGADPALLLARLETEPDDSIRAALWLGLGGFDENILPAARRVELTPKLLDVYRRDGSAAVHAAVYWLLGKWGARDAAHTIDREIANRDAGKGKSWYVNSHGQTMVVITGPIKFMMGVAPGKPGQSDIERQHLAQIDYSYDIGMTEVTLGQFRAFLKQSAEHDRASRYVKQARAAADRPVAKVSWYDAACYCNWLSNAEGIPPDQWCYEPNNGGAFASGMKIAPNYHRRIGYRLPTEAEWEYACRGGAGTRRCYGDSDDLLQHCAWYSANADDAPLPAAKLLPNAFGLFDMHGNVSEWCQNALDLHAASRPSGDAEIVTDPVFRAVRGGSVSNLGRQIYSARRFADRPSFSETGGFRIARSHP